ncbi:hypothetical protein DEO72_LG7g1733 [Vigna unguiculata]|uniref:Uncharacterized protein n=1 Tax=Vigna unguiculata TaxID=3917 RepID=A0A4D6MG90_VIGUN|nr:hypothetical protein DEO72_LG7g1733 [Vigna unguiculata]
MANSRWLPWLRWWRYHESVELGAAGVVRCVKRTAVLAWCKADHTGGCGGVGTGAAGDIEQFGGINGGSSSVTKWRRRSVMETDECSGGSSNTTAETVGLRVVDGLMVRGVSRCAQ